MFYIFGNANPEIQIQFIQEKGVDERIIKSKFITKRISSLSFLNTHLAKVAML